MKTNMRDERRLIERIRLGKLDYTQTNAEKVRDAWCDIVAWNAFFDEAGLGWTSLTTTTRSSLRESMSCMAG